MMGLGIPALASFFITVLAIVALRPLAVAVDLIDRPGGRKTHHGEVPIIGGIAMFLGVVTGIGVIPEATPVRPEFLAACSVLVTIGLLDDRFDLSPWTRLPVQMAAAVLMIIGTGATVRTLGHLPGGLEVTLHGLVAGTFTVLITIAAINAFNMLDGMDGLAGATAVIALLGLGYLAWSKGLYPVTVIGLVFAGAVTAFLMFNVPIRLNRPMRCFMGDAGSTLLGFTVAWTCIRISQGPVQAAAPVVTLWLVALPLYELIWTTIRRLIRGVSPFRPDRSHFHHLLLQAGFGVRGAFLIYICLASALAILGILLNQRGVAEWRSLVFLAAGGAVVVRFMYRAELVAALIPRRLRRSAAVDAGNLSDW